MSPKIEPIQDRMSLKMNVSKMECLLKWNVTKNVMSLKMECHPKLNVPQHAMSLKM